MTRRLLAAAALLAVALPGVASASFSVRNPADGCVHTVWTPTYSIHGGPPGPPGITSTGGFGYSVTCP